jgi:hypothetical protein
LVRVGLDRAGADRIDTNADEPRHLERSHMAIATMTIPVAARISKMRGRPPAPLAKTTTPSPLNFESKPVELPVQAHASGQRL